MSGCELVAPLRPAPSPKMPVGQGGMDPLPRRSPGWMSRECRPPAMLQGPTAAAAQVALHHAGEGRAVFSRRRLTVRAGCVAASRRWSNTTAGYSAVASGCTSPSGPGAAPPDIEAPPPQESDHRSSTGSACPSRRGATPPVGGDLAPPAGGGLSSTSGARALWRGAAQLVSGNLPAQASA